MPGSEGFPFRAFLPRHPPGCSTARHPYLQTPACRNPARLFQETSWILVPVALHAAGLPGVSAARMELTRPMPPSKVNAPAPGIHATKPIPWYVIALRGRHPIGAAVIGPFRAGNSGNMAGRDPLVHALPDRRPHGAPLGHPVAKCLIFGKFPVAARVGTKMPDIGQSVLFVIRRPSFLCLFTQSGICGDQPPCGLIVQPPSVAAVPAEPLERRQKQVARVLAVPRKTGVEPV